MADIVDVDDLWRSLGTWGRFQTTQLFVLLVGIWSCGFHVLSIVFIGYRPDYQCKEIQIDNGSQLDTSIQREYDRCTIRTIANNSGSISVSETSCLDGMQYSTPKDRSLVTEWDLVCDREGLAEVSQTLMMIGQVVGATAFTALADRFGRKPVHVLCHIALFVIALGTSFVPNYTAFAILKFITGAVQQGVCLVLAVINLEYFPMETRAYCEVLGLLFWSTGVFLITPFGYFLRNVSWRYFQIAVSLCSAWSLIEWWLIEESPRWLIANGKLDEAKRIIKKACRINKKNYEEVVTKSGFRQFELEFNLKKASFKKSAKKQELTNNGNSPREDNGQLLKKGSEDNQDELATHTRSNSVPTVSAEVRKLTMIDLVKSKRLLIVSMIMWFTWITNSATYFGLMLISTRLAGNRFLNFCLSAVVEFPACFIEFFLFNRIGRKKTCIVFHGICGIALFTATALTSNAHGNVAMEIASTVFTLIGKMCITGSFSTIFLYTPELYPTNLRNFGMGMSSAAARIGAAVAPYSRNLIEVVQWGPGAIFGGFCIIVTVLMFFVPETNQYELPQTMKELKAWYKLNQFGFKTRAPVKEIIVSDSDGMSNDKKESLDT